MLVNELKTNELPVIPDKRYFTIGEVANLCRVKSHVLRYWEQEFRHLNPVRRGNRRYYRRTDVLLVRFIRSLLYDQRFTLDGARNQLANYKNYTLTDDNISAFLLEQEKNKSKTIDYEKILQQVKVELEELLESMENTGT